MPNWLRARDSVVGLPAKIWLTVEGSRLSLFEAGECVESRDVADPLQQIERYQQQFMSAPAPELPVFHGECECPRAVWLDHS